MYNMPISLLFDHLSNNCFANKILQNLHVSQALIDKLTTGEALHLCACSRLTLYEEGDTLDNFTKFSLGFIVDDSKGSKIATKEHSRNHKTFVKRQFLRIELRSYFKFLERNLGVNSHDKQLRIWSHQYNFPDNVTIGVTLQKAYKIIPSEAADPDQEIYNDYVEGLDIVREVLVKPFNQYTLKNINRHISDRKESI